MSLLNGLLVAQSTVHQIPTIAVIACAVALSVAFIIGFIKGFRTVAWGGFYWLATGIGFIFVYKALEKANPFASTFTGDKAGLGHFLWATILLVLCLIVALICYAVLSVKYRPRRVLAPKLGPEMDEYGFVYEDDREDDCPYHDDDKYVLVGVCKPSFLGRIGGGVMSALNMAAILASIISIVLLFIGRTGLVNGSLGAIFDVKLTQIVLDYAATYAFDFFTIGIIIWVAHKGYDYGFIGSLRTVLIGLGILFIEDVAFIIPFTKAADFYFIARLIDRCTSLFTTMDPQTAQVLGKLVAGGLMTVFGFILLAVIAILLKKATKAIEEHMSAYIIDEILAVFLYLIFGVALVATFWAALYLLDYCGVFHASEAFSDKATLAREFFNAAECLLKDFAENSLLKFKLN